MQFGAKQLGWLSMVAAAAAIVISAVGRNVGSESVIVVGLIAAAFALAVGVLAMRTAVRTDSGVPHSLFGLSFGFLALVLAVFLLGAQKGAVYSG